MTNIFFRGHQSVDNLVNDDKGVANIRFRRLPWLDNFTFVNKIVFSIKHFEPPNVRPKWSPGPDYLFGDDYTVNPAPPKSHNVQSKIQR